MHHGDLKFVLRHLYFSAYKACTSRAFCIAAYDHLVSGQDAGSVPVEGSLGGAVVYDLEQFPTVFCVVIAGSCCRFKLQD